MKSESAPNVSSDERTMAALAYFFGAIGAFVVWALQKDKSRFVRFHALQSLAFSALVVAVNMVVMLGLFVFMFAGAAILLAAAARGAAPGNSNFPAMLVPSFFPILIMLCIWPVSLISGLIQLIAAISVATGRDFRYPWIASRLERFLAD